MGVYYSAKVVYGVLLDEEEEIRLNSHPNRDTIYDNWICDADFYNKDSYKVIGIIVDGVSEGEATELCAKAPNVDELLDVLDELGINREPTWHLVCTVS